MPVTVCWAAKGGSGTTVVAATIALSCPTDSLLVDLDGELPAVLGLSEPAGQGVADWLASDAPPGALDDLAIPVDRTTRLIPRGSAMPDRRAGRWAELGAWLTTRPAAGRRRRQPPASRCAAGRRRPQPARHSRLLPGPASSGGRPVPPRRRRADRRARAVAAHVRRRHRGRRAGRGRGQPRPGHRPRRRQRTARRPAPAAAVPGTARCGMSERVFERANQRHGERAKQRDGASPQATHEAMVHQ